MNNKRKISHFVDISVGKRLRMRRIELQWSQEKLGKAIGLTFQQIQKYERGINRISVSKLYELSKALKIDINYFFIEVYPMEQLIHQKIIIISSLEK